MSKRFIILAVAVVSITIAIGFFAMQPAQVPDTETSNKSTTGAGAAVGSKLSEFTLAALDGKTVRVAPAGSVIVLNFWATWCPPCRQEMPELNAFARKYNSKAVLLAVNIQESAGKVDEFMRQNEYTMNVLLDKDGEVARNFRISAIPTTLVVDKNGFIKYRKSGPVTAAELEGVLNGL
ncbi:Thiol-disulfide oxidoreductase ResA [Sporomusa carbonis]|uniref:TlpA family protein disulfide reductase n=1 Tax=Sporomusa carbonis TaxID=3076075 RepID=UPI003A785925